jgi:chromosome segregation ATPase
MDKSMICQRCLKSLHHGIHTCTPTDLVRKLEAKVEELTEQDKCGDELIESLEKQNTMLQDKLAAMTAERDGSRRAHQNDLDKLRQEEAEVAELRKDAERGRYMIKHGEWFRSAERTHLAVCVPQGSDLSCYATREMAIDAAMKEAQS